MSKQITITLPDSFEVKGMQDAPERLRQVATEKWDEDFCLEALRHGVSQPLGDVWSVSKKDIGKLEKKWQAFQDGDWTTRERTGQSAAVFQAKFDKAIAELNVQALAEKLTPEKLAALAAMVKPDK
jgi:hypothetical protein